MAWPRRRSSRTCPAGQDGGFVRHAFIGENGKPLLKIQDFDARMRSGIGEQVDVAMMKLCYVDITRRHGRRRAVRHLPRDHRRPGAGLPGGHLRPRDRAADDRAGTAVEAEEPAHRERPERPGRQRGPGTAECPDPAASTRAATSSTWRRSSPPRPTAAARLAPTRGSGTTGCTTATLPTPGTSTARVPGSQPARG